MANTISTESVITSAVMNSTTNNELPSQIEDVLDQTSSREEKKKKKSFKLFLCIKFICKTVRKCLIKLISLFIFLSFILSFAVFVYATFIFRYMPSNNSIMSYGYEKDSTLRAYPVNFVFEPCVESSRKCSFLNASVNLIKRDSSSQQGGVAIKSSTDATDADTAPAAGLLWNNQFYSIVLEVRYPAVQYSYRGGMVLHCVEFFDIGNTSLSNSCRSVLIQPIPYWRHEITALLKLPLHYLSLTDVSPDLIRKEITFQSMYMDNPLRKLKYLNVEIRSRHFDIESATLHIYIHYTGLRYFIYHHPILSASIGISSIFCSLISLSLFFWSTLIQTVFFGTKSRQSSSTENVVTEEDAKREIKEENANEELKVYAVEDVGREIICTSQATGEDGLRKVHVGGFHEEGASEAVERKMAEQNTVEATSSDDESKVDIKIESGDHVEPEIAEGNTSGSKTTSKHTATSAEKSFFVSKEEVDVKVEDAFDET